MLALDTAAYTSAWRDRHPAEKAILAVGLLGCAVALPPWPGAVIVAGVATVALLGPAGLRPSRLARAIRAPLGFVVAGALPLLVRVGGEHPVSWDPEGPETAARLTGRAIAALLCLVLFAGTTPLADVLPRLTRLGVPSAVTEIAILIYRMLFLLLDTARAVRAAQAARLGDRTPAARYRSLAGQSSTILVRAFDRARRMERGLALRGYTGSLQVAVPARQISPRFVVASLVVVGAVIAAASVARGPW